AAASRPARLPRWRAPGPGHRLDIAAGRGVAGLQRRHRLPDGLGAAAVHARPGVALHPADRPGRRLHGPWLLDTGAPPAVLAATGHGRATAQRRPTGLAGPTAAGGATGTVAGRQ